MVVTVLVQLCCPATGHYGHGHGVDLWSSESSVFVVVVTPLQPVAATGLAH